MSFFPSCRLAMVALAGVLLLNGCGDPKKAIQDAARDEARKQAEAQVRTEAKRIADQMVADMALKE